MSGTRIIIDGGPEIGLRKITQVLPYSEGGFGVLMPYHSARHGYLAKHPVHYFECQSRIPRSEFAEYTADDRVKLSIHQDGFVQFSSENQGSIVSGLDPETGQPKGLGLFSQPLQDPIQTGPTFGVAVWGLADFAECAERDLAESVVFQQDDMYFRHCTPTTWDGGYLIEGFVFPGRYWQAVRQRGDRNLLTIAHREFEIPGTMFEFRVVQLAANQSIFVGVIVSKVQRFSNRVPSGFLLHSPSEFRAADALLASYPPMWDAAESSPSLNYEAQESPESLDSDSLPNQT